MKTKARKYKKFFSFRWFFENDNRLTTTTVALRIVDQTRSEWRRAGYMVCTLVNYVCQLSRNAVVLFRKS